MCGHFLFDLALFIKIKILLRALAIKLGCKKEIDLCMCVSGISFIYGNGILSTSDAVNQQHFLFTSIHFPWIYIELDVWQL